VSRSDELIVTEACALINSVQSVGSFQGKPELNTRGENLQGRTLEGRERKTQSIHCFKKNVSSCFMRNTIMK